MRYINSYKLFESTITKSYLVDKIKYLSNWLETYMMDTNKYVDSNLNFGFSYDTELTISEIFQTVKKLDHESPDGFITAICNEFIKWSRFFTKNSSKYDDVISTGNLHNLLPDPIFLTNYDNYDDGFYGYKATNKGSLYKQELRNALYVYVGERIKQMISGTVWDIPLKKEFTDDDREFVLDCLLSESEYYSDIDNIVNSSLCVKTKARNGGVILKLLVNDPNTYQKELTRLLNYDSDFMWRLQSYFGGVLSVISNYRSYCLYLPFHN